MKNAFRENAIHFFKFVKDMQEQCIRAGVEPLRLRRYYSRGEDNVLHKTHMTVEQMLAEDDGQGSFHDIWEDVEDNLSDCSGDVQAQEKHQQQQKQLSTNTSHGTRRPDTSFSNLQPLRARIELNDWRKCAQLQRELSDQTLNAPPHQV